MSSDKEYSLELSDDVVQFRDLAHEFAKKKIRPAAAECDQNQRFPWEIVQEAAQVGFYSDEFVKHALLEEPSGLLLPVVVEELFWGDAGIGLSIFGSSLAAAGITAAAAMSNWAQVEEWVPQCYGTPDDVKLGAFCVSEPEAGSDVSNLRTRAVYDEAKDEWVINGVKEWITNGGIANIHVVVASVDPELKGRGQASFIIPPGTKGLEQVHKHDKLGIRASHTAQLSLQDVRVPGSCLLGTKEELDARLARARERLNNPQKKSSTGGQPAMQTFEATRPTVGAQAVGIARAALEYSLDYAKDRKVFGVSSVEKQLVAGMLADMATEVDAARLLVHRAAWMGKHGGYKNAEGSMSKLKAGRTAVWVTERAIQILGGAGFVKDHPVERWHRDSIIYNIFEGTEQIQQIVIARALSGHRID